MDDLFGEPPAPLEVTSETMDWQPESTVGDHVAAHDAAAEEQDGEVEVDEVDGEGELGTEGEEPPAEEGDGEEPELPEHLAGKSPVELAKMIGDQRSAYAAQSNEIGELRRLAEEQSATNRELLGHLQQLMAPQPQQVDTSGLAGEAMNNPQGAYLQAVQLVNDGHATPDVVDEVLAVVEDMNPQQARLLQQDWMRRVITAQVRSEFGEMLKPIQQKVETTAGNDYQSQLNLATSELYSDPALGEDAKAYEQDVVNLLKGQHLGGTKAEIRAKLESALTVARGMDMTKSPKYQKALEALKVDSQTESGDGGVEPPPAKKSEADAYRERVFAVATRTATDPGAGMFA